MKLEMCMRTEPMCARGPAPPRRGLRLALLSLLRFLHLALLLLCYIRGNLASAVREDVMPLDRFIKLSLQL